MYLPFLTDVATTGVLSRLGLNVADLIVFFVFLLLVVFVAFSASRKSGESSESYFLAGRGLSWWLIGFSLIAANISAEQFIGMSGQASDYIGLAVASYEWIAAISLVIVAFFFLPKFLKAGVYTIPEYLERRYSKLARTIMSLLMMVMLVAVNITVVTYAGAKAYAVFFEAIPQLNLTFFCWVIGIVAAVYIFTGGLKACAWADLLQGSALILAGAVVLYFSLKKLGCADAASFVGIPGVDELTASGLADANAWTRFNDLNAAKLRMNLPSWDRILPLTALIFAIWIPNLYYWGLNQYIIQRTLGAKSLGEGQKGLIFAAALKLLIPFIVIFPGMIAFNLYYRDMQSAASEKSQGELARFEAAQKSMDGSPESIEAAKKAPLFLFNHDFANLYPEQAQGILDYNATVANVKTPIKKINRTLTLAQQLEAQKALISQKNQSGQPGYTFNNDKMLTGFDHDAAFPLLIRNLIPSNGFKGFLLAALLGAIISSIASMLNAASTIFTMDIYKEYLHRSAKEKELVWMGRAAVIVFVLIGCLVAPIWANPKYEGVFKAIQEFQGYISPGIFAAFLFGFLVRKAPSFCGTFALVACPILYGLFHTFCPALDFLNRMAVTFVIIIAVMTLLRILFPRKEAFDPEKVANDNANITEEFLQESRWAKIFGVVIVLATVGLYFYYWDYTSQMF